MTDHYDIDEMLKLLPTDILRYIVCEFYTMEYTLEHDKSPIKSLYGRFEKSDPFLVFPNVVFRKTVDGNQNGSVFSYKPGEFYPKMLRSLESKSDQNIVSVALTTLLYYCKSFPELTSIRNFQFKDKFRTRYKPGELHKKLSSYIPPYKNRPTKMDEKYYCGVSKNEVPSDLFVKATPTFLQDIPKSG
jgi:hypothetical protein